MSVETNTSTVTGVSLKWIDNAFTSLQVEWDPVTAPQGGIAIYRISHSPVLATGMMVTNETEGLNILLTGLNPELFYSVIVEFFIQDTEQATSNAGKCYQHIFLYYIVSMLRRVELCTPFCLYVFHL